jgi:plastocyanin
MHIALHIKIFLLSFFILAIGAVISAPTFASSHRVQMKSISYDPKILEIKPGDTVQWDNKSFTEHSATSYENEKSNSKFDTGLIQPQKASEIVQFHEVGTFLYHCQVHGKTMTGKIIVIK